MLAVGCEAYAGDEAHNGDPTSASFRGALLREPGIHMWTAPELQEFLMV
jgi:hypothetical protein